MRLGQVGAHDPVLDRRQEPVGDVLPARHAGREGRAGDQQARAEDQVGPSLDDRRDHLRDQAGLVLAVRVEHHHDVRVVLEGLQVAGLLVAAVADLVRMPDDLDGQLARQLDRLVGGRVVDQDDLGDLVERDLGDGLAQRRGRLACRHHDDDLRRRREPRRPCGGRTQSFARAEIAHVAPQRRRFRRDGSRSRPATGPRRAGAAARPAASAADPPPRGHRRPSEPRAVEAPGRGADRRAAHPTSPSSQPITICPPRT